MFFILFRLQRKRHFRLCLSYNIPIAMPATAPMSSRISDLSMWAVAIEIIILYLLIWASPCSFARACRLRSFSEQEHLHNIQYNIVSSNYMLLCLIRCLKDVKELSDAPIFFSRGLSKAADSHEPAVYCFLLTKIITGHRFTACFLSSLTHLKHLRY